MVVISSDGKRSVQIGSSDVMLSLYSTITVRLNEFAQDIPLAMDFLNTLECVPANGLKTAREINLLIAARRRLSFRRLSAVLKRYFMMI